MPPSVMSCWAAYLLTGAAVATACGGGSFAPTTAAPGAVAAPASGPPGSAVVMPGVPIAQSGPADLTLGYVERLPKIDYVINAADPGSQGWPDPGSQVTWRAHLKNWSSRRLDNVDFAWRLDGADVGSGTVSVPADSEAAVDLPWTWDRSRHTLELRVDASNRFTVRGGPRNHLLVYTDALAIGLYVEQGVYDYFRRYQPELRIGNSSFEDWAQLQMELWNLLLAQATYADTPQGALDRVRLDAVHVVPDGSLPLDPLAFSIGGAFAAPEARPNVADRTVDMQWGFPDTVLEFDGYGDHTSLGTSNPFYYSGFIQHEMGHARYLVDVYAWEVFDGTAGSRVDITEGGVHVAGSRYMPGTPWIYNGVSGIQVHSTPHQGLMTYDWTYLDDYSTAALNRIAGDRPLDGNYNEPANIGAFLNDLPRENQLALSDRDGHPLSGARVQVFQATPGDPTQPYAKLYDATPDLDLRADDQGEVRLGRNPFSSDSPIVLHDFDPSVANGTIILRIEQGGRVGYAFLESTDFNLEYWRGHQDLGRYSLTVTLF